MDDFDISPDRVGESAQRVLDRAVEESRRRGHAEVTNEDVFLAFARVEWDTYSQVMRELQLNPHEIVHALSEYLDSLPKDPHGTTRVASPTKLVLKMALHRATRSGRQAVESDDLLSSVVEESHGVAVSGPAESHSCGS